MSREILEALKLYRECLKTHLTEINVSCIKDVREAYEAVTEALNNADLREASTEMSEAEKYDREQCVTAKLLDMYGYD